MSIDLWLAEQTKELIEELSTRASKAGVLSPGQQIILTLEVKEIPTVVIGEVDSILSMHIPSFFTTERCTPFTDNATSAVMTVGRIRSQIYGVTDKKNFIRDRAPAGRYLTTVRDVVEAGSRRLRSRGGVGDKMIGVMKQALESEGISLPD